MAAQVMHQALAGDDGVQQRLARVARAWRTYRVYRATAAELRALSVRERDDIGLAGADLDAVARKAAYGI